MAEDVILKIESSSIGSLYIVSSDDNFSIEGALVSGLKNRYLILKCWVFRFLKCFSNSTHLISQIEHM